MLLCPLSLSTVQFYKRYSQVKIFNDGKETCCCVPSHYLQFYKRCSRVKIFKKGRKHVVVYPLTIYSTVQFYKRYSRDKIFNDGKETCCSVSSHYLLYSSTKDIHELRFLTMERKHVAVYPLTIYCTVLQKIFTGKDF